MNKKNFELMARYNKKVNAEMNEIIKTLTEEEWNKQFAGYYKSIHELCSHIFAGDQWSLSKLNTTGEYKSLSDKGPNMKYDFDKLLFESIDEYVSRREEMDNILVDFVTEISGEDLDKSWKYVTSKGIENFYTVRTGLTHLSHHQTHHRGMISLYLEFLGKENDFSYLFIYE